MLNRYIKATRSNFWLSPFWMTVAFLLLEIFLTVLVVGGFHEHDLPLVGGVVALFTGGIILLIVILGLVICYFDIFLSFGRTRRAALGMVAKLAGIHTAICTVLSLLFIEIEKHFLPALLTKLGGFSEYRLEPLLIPEGSFPPSGVLFTAPLPLPWWAIPLILCAVAVVAFVAGTIVRRWGSKAGWTLYLLFIAFILSSNRTDSLFERLLPLILIGAVVFLVGGLIWSVRELLRSPIHT